MLTNVVFVVCYLSAFGRPCIIEYSAIKHLLLCACQIHDEGGFVVWHYLRKKERCLFYFKSYVLSRVLAPTVDPASR